jgi:hypothetical protein
VEGVTMMKRTIACGVGAAFALALSLPVAVSAKGFNFPHSGIPLHNLSRSHHHHHMIWPYSYYGYGYGYGGYGGPVATYTPADYGYGEPVAVMPQQAAPTITVIQPRCSLTRETITVPAEGGGERQVTITRCP